MDVRDGFAGNIGNTPLVRIASLSDETGCEILGKAEFMNPGGSVKDRAALWMVREHERSGALKPGGIVVEGTAGNTGIGLVHVCNARNYATVIYMPDNQSPEKVELLQTLGAEVRVVPTVPYRDDANYQKQAGRYADATPGAVWANQFDNTANRLAHYESTGPEIWAQTDGQLDVFTCSTGTGGTLAGVSRFMKEKDPAVKIIASDPHGSAIYNWVTTGEATMTPGPSITEGIGNSRVTDNLAGTVVDDAVQVTDQAMVSMVYRMLRDEGWFFGSSTGINLCAAVEIAKTLGPGHTIVTVLCDGGSKYQSRLFNEAWLAEKGLAFLTASDQRTLVRFSRRTPWPRCDDPRSTRYARGALPRGPSTRSCLHLPRHGGSSPSCIGRQPAGRRLAAVPAQGSKLPTRLRVLPGWQYRAASTARLPADRKAGRAPSPYLDRRVGTRSSCRRSRRKIQPAQTRW